MNTDLPSSQRARGLADDADSTGQRDADRRLTSTAPHSEILAEVERQRIEQAGALLRVYNVYRLLLGGALLALLQQNLFTTQLGNQPHQLLLWSVFGYLAANSLIALAPKLLPSTAARNPLLSVAVVGADILALAWLIWLSGGVAGGLATLLVVTVAAGAILVPGRLSLALASMATIALLYQELVLVLRYSGNADEMVQAGVLGVAFFAIALLTQYLSRRLRDNEIKSMTQAVELADLERVNRLIIQRMRTGIILVDGSNHVRMTNFSARSLLGYSDIDSTFALPAALQQRLNDWRGDMRVRSGPFQLAPNTPEIRVNFSAVRSDEPAGDVTIFLEDVGEVQQQAQQLKLAALARLSGKIAHEIRNPLGAISHASQLLQESTNLDAADSRLTDIIHSHCLRMDGVVENVLELSRRKPPSPERVNMHQHLTSFIDTWLATQRESGLGDAEIDLEVNPIETELRVDPSQLNQALTNLLDNGMRYSAEHSGRRYMRLQGGIDRATMRPYLDVIDIGAGVPEDEVATLFKPFVTNSPSGTGLGLYICQELCEANQAGISYQRHTDGGSCFHIIFAHPNRIIG